MTIEPKDEDQLEQDELDSLSSAPESGQPPGGREHPENRGESPTPNQPPPEANGEDF